ACLRHGSRARRSSTSTSHPNSAAKRSSRCSPTGSSASFCAAGHLAKDSQNLAAHALTSRQKRASVCPLVNGTARFGERDGSRCCEGDCGAAKDDGEGTSRPTCGVVRRGEPIVEPPVPVSAHRVARTGDGGGRSVGTREATSKGTGARGGSAFASARGL